MKQEKKILDATCGSRMMWFDKKNPDVLFADMRSEQHTLCDGRVLDVKPDVVMDFRKMHYADNTFKLVVFDPPHFEKLGGKSWLALKYGKLSDTWREDIKQGFDECMRVLAVDGILILKWNERQIKVNEIVKLIQYKPLFGHTTSKGGHTIWMTFMKTQ